MRNLTTAIIAKTCHEVNRAFCESQGDDSQRPWEQAETWQRESAVKGVEFAVAAFDRGERPTPAQQHENWAKDKFADGWTFGEVKDAEKKTHPCLVPYIQLPAGQRVKDALFLAVVTALALDAPSDASARKD